MKDWIKNEIVKYVLESKDNWFEEINEHYFDQPLVQFASADDPLFSEYKEIIGKEHLTPAEAFELAYGEGSYQGGTVISVVLPVNEKIRKSNAMQKEKASREWALLRAFGDEIFRKKFYADIESYFIQQGYKTVAPCNRDWFKKFKAADGPSSNWSERHAAFTAGLGTFSLNDGFITEKGIAVKLASFVTELKLEPDVRLHKKHNENCFYCSKGKCGACIKRCPAGAISEAGHDKMKCFLYVYGEESKKLAESYGGNYQAGAGCGLCQTKVPCESKNPIDK